MRATTDILTLLKASLMIVAVFTWQKTMWPKVDHNLLGFCARACAAVLGVETLM